jgi:hypothetical protein
MQHKKNNRRNSRGSMLVLTILCIYVVVLMVVALIGFMLTCYQITHQQNLAEPEVMTVAEILNSDNGIGNLNDVTAASRELTFTSHCQLNKAQSPRYKYFGDLATDLHYESRNSASILEAQRQQTIDDAVEKIKTYITNYNMRKRSQSSLDNVVFRSPIQIVDVELGYGSYLEGSGYVPEAMPELEEFDYGSGVANRNSQLYRPKDQLSVPYDEDLPYVMSPLPAHVDGVTSPARLLPASDFCSLGKLMENGKMLKLQLRQIPSAAKVTVETFVKGTNQPIRVTAFATSHGAESPLWKR